jgi:DNA polymerase
MQFANGEDVYALFASSIYGYAVNKKDHIPERFIGKTGILGLGYGSGYVTFLHMVLTSDQPIAIDEEFASKVVETYRSRYPQIRKLWTTAGKVLKAMSEGQMIRFGPCYTDSNRLWLPSGLALTYPQLENPDMDRFRIANEWHYYKPRYKAFARIFGAKLVENMVQALARIQITDTMLRMRATSKDWHCALQVHDELIYVAPDDEAEDCDRYLSAYMNMQPAWVSEYPMALPLANEGGIGEVYGDIKG